MRKVTAEDFTRGQKVAHVKAAKFTKGHTCHWPGCTKDVKPALWGCYPHWMRLPKHLQDKIWQTYQPGQEDSKTPSEDYIIAAKAVQAWIEAHVSKM